MKAEHLLPGDPGVKAQIEVEGQAFVDEPVYVEVSKAAPLSLAVNHALKSLRAPHSAAPGGPRIEPEIKDLAYYERVQLRWMTPGRDGRLVPKYAPDR